MIKVPDETAKLVAISQPSGRALMLVLAAVMMLGILSRQREDHHPRWFRHSGADDRLHLLCGDRIQFGWTGLRFIARRAGGHHR